VSGVGGVPLCSDDLEGYIWDILLYLAGGLEGSGWEVKIFV